MDAVTHAIADPVRRDILTLLRDGDLPAGEIAASFTISRPAISRHLRVLRAAGVVIDESVGRRRVYRLDVAPLVVVEDWLRDLRAGEPHAWGSRLDALETEVHRARRDREQARTTGSLAEEAR